MRKILVLCPMAPALLVLLMVVGSLSTGCMGEVHINGVAPENQAVEQFILATGNALGSLEKARNVALDTAAKLYKADELSLEDLKTARSISKKFDVAYKAAAEALSDFAKASRSGESVTNASVEAALTAVRSALTELKGEI